MQRHRELRGDAVTGARSLSASFASSGGPVAGCTLPRGTATTPVISSTHPKVLLNHAATKSCLQQLLTSGAPSATRFKTMVDNQMAGGDYYGFEPWYAALMYQVTGEQRYATYAIAQTDALVAAEEALIAANQRADGRRRQLPLRRRRRSATSRSSTTGATSLLTPTQRTRWLAYANQAVWNVWNHRAGQVGQHHLSPGAAGRSTTRRTTTTTRSCARPCCSASPARARTRRRRPGSTSSAPRRSRTSSSRPSTATSPAAARARARATAWRCGTCGSCTTGGSGPPASASPTRTPHTLASMAHMMHSIVPTLDRLAPIGDHARDSTAALFDYHRDYLLELMSLFPQERLSGAAKTLLDASSVPRMAQYFKYFVDFLYEPPQLPATPLTDLSTTYWAPGTGQLMMRSGWDTGATFVELHLRPVHREPRAPRPGQLRRLPRRLARLRRQHRLAPRASSRARRCTTSCASRRAAAR